MKKITGIAAGSLLAALIGVCAYGAFSDSVSVLNRISMGDVNISLEEYQIQETGEEQPYQNPKEIVPGQTVSKIPRITNRGEPCYVRARVLFENSEDSIDGFTDQNLIGISEDWEKHGEYYYYRKILDRKESIDLFQSVWVPEFWTEEHAGQQLRILIDADAVQAVNFKPDFSAASPWSDLTIEKCIHEEDGYVVETKEYTDLLVEFEGSAGRLIAVPEDFFRNLPYLMPGDLVSDRISVENRGSSPVEIFFRTEETALTDEERDFLEQISLSISCRNKVLYEGKLLSENLRENVSLGLFDAGENTSMEFTLKVPEELGNDYALRGGQVKWIYSVSGEDPSVVTGGGGSGAYGTTASTEPADVQTGDPSPIALWILLFLGSGCIVICLITHKGGRRCEKK